MSHVDLILVEPPLALSGLAEVVGYQATRAGIVGAGHKITAKDGKERAQWQWKQHRRLQKRSAQALLLVEQGQTLASVARLLGTAAHRIRIWQTRFAAEGRQGLIDRSRRGRSPVLDEAGCTFLEEALEQGPHAYGLPVMIWSIRDLQSLLLRERGISVSIYTMHWVVHALGYRYRRPRHDLRHRQDAEALAAAKRVLDWLEKKALLSPNDPIGNAVNNSTWSTSTNARSISALPGKSLEQAGAADEDSRSG